MLFSNLLPTYERIRYFKSAMKNLHSLMMLGGHQLSAIFLFLACAVAENFLVVQKSMKFLRML